jgi:NitT/TauT family transport system permease protein
MSAQIEQAATSGTADVPGILEPRPRSRLARLDRGLWMERVAGYVFFIGIWQIFSGAIIEDFILPPPTEVLGEMINIVRTGELWQHGASTFRLIFVAFALTLVLGTAVGVAMGLSRWFDGFFRDGLLIAFSTPGLIFVLVSLMVFGIAAIGPIAAIVACATPYVAINVWEGVKGIPKDIMTMAQSFRMDRATKIRHIVIPAVLPYMFQGMRFGFAITWKIAMLTEVFGGNEGIGFNIRLEFQLFQMGRLLAWVLWFFVSALLLERLVLQRLVDRSLRWRGDVTGALR